MGSSIEELKEEIMRMVADNELDKLIALSTNDSDFNFHHSRTGFTPLIGASYSNYLGIVNFLITRGVNVDAISKDESKSTALHFASRNKHLSVVKTLVENGANINSRDFWGNTPLFHATGNNELIKYFLDNKSDPYLKNDYGISPLNSRSEGLRFIKEYLNVTEDNEETNYFTLQ